MSPESWSRFRAWPGTGSGRSSSMPGRRPCRFARCPRFSNCWASASRAVSPDRFTWPTCCGTHVDCEQPPEAYLRAATVLITGAGGSIGAELARQVARAAPTRLVLLGHGENSIHDIRTQLQLAHPELDAVPVIADIRDADAVRRVFDAERPAVVFHAAAHKHVPLMEAPRRRGRDEQRAWARRTVVEPTEARRRRALRASSPPTRPCSPRSVMGATKRVAELIVRDARARHRPRFTTVRFGNVLGAGQRGAALRAADRPTAGRSPSPTPG